MAQVVNNGDAFQAPSGVGAVIFDYPKEQPLDILLKANQDIDNWNRAKALKAIQDRNHRYKMLADIKFETKGALDQDIRDAIQPAANDAIDYFAKNVAQYDEASPEFRQNMVEFRRRQMNVEALVQESARHKEMFAEVNKPLDPSKVDVDATNTAVATARLLPLNKRIDWMKENGGLIKPRKETIDEIILEGIKPFVAHPTTTSVEQNKIDGHNISTETTQTLPYDKSVVLANGWMQNNYKGFKDKIYNVIEGWMQKGEDANGVPNDPNFKYYTEKALTYTGANGERYTPAELYAADQIYKNNALNVSRQNLGNDPYYTAYQSEMGKGDVEEKNGAALVDLISGVFTGKDKLFHAKEVTINGQKKNAVATDALNSYSLGTFPRQYKGEDGKTYIDNADNYILETIRSADGKVYVKTTETFEKALNKEGGFEKNPYIMFNNASELYNAIGGGLPADKKEKIMNGGRKYIEKKGASTGGMAFDPNKIAPVTTQEKVSYNKLHGIEVKVVENKTPDAAPTQQQLKQPAKTTQKSSGKKQYKAAEITQTVVDAIKDGDIVIVDGIERVKQDGKLKKVKI